MDRRLVNPSARRCLFGRPTNTDFLQKQKKMEEEEVKRFKRAWDLDGVENKIQWRKPDSNEYVPEFYTKVYSHKCRRRAVQPSIGKSLSFEDSDEDSCKNVTEEPSPVQYTCAAPTVEVFIGLLPRRSPEESSTTSVQPKSDGSHSTTKSENRNSDVCLKLKQKRLTEVWRVVKRPRPQTSEQLHKRARLDRL